VVIDQEQRGNLAGLIANGFLAADQPEPEPEPKAKSRKRKTS
jgi:hypothetical protein